jgi:MFS family permease
VRGRHEAGAASNGSSGLLRRPQFRRILLATGLSSLGDEVAIIALTIRVFDLTGSGPTVSLLLAVMLVPLILFAPLAGLLVDRHGPKRMLVVASLAQAGLAAMLGFASAIPVIVGLSFALGIGVAVAQPALFALVPALVPHDRLTAANGYLESSRYLGAVLGPLLAGLLASAFGAGWALAIDAVSFLVIAAAAASLRVARSSEADEGEEGQERAREGFSFIRRDGVLLLMLVSVGGLMLFAATDNVAEVFFVKDVLAAGDAGFGALVASWMLGMVLGAMVLAPRLRPGRLAVGALGAGVVSGIAVALTGLSQDLVVACGLFAVGGVGNGIMSVSTRSLIHHRAPERLRGRVFAAFSAVVNGTQLAATASAGLLIALVGARGTLVIGGIGGALVALGGIVWLASLDPENRTVEVIHLPDEGEVVELPEEPDVVRPFEP